MQIKKNKTVSKSKSLSNKKEASDAKSHLDFSITKKVIHTDDYESLVTKRGHKHKKSDLQKNNSPDSRVKKSKSSTHALVVNKRDHKKSPFVVRLLDEWESTAPIPEIKKKPKINEPNTGSRKDSGEWLKEVQRLRTVAARTYKNKINSVTIDLLANNRKKEKTARKHLQLKGLHARAGKGVLVGLRGIVRWIFEFILSIPLGFLLAFSVLISLVEVSNRAAIKGAKYAGKGVSWVVEHAVISVAAIMKALFVIPIKLVTIGVMGIYRALSSGSSFVLSLGSSSYDAVKNYAKVVHNPPKHFFRKLGVVLAAGVALILPVKFLESAPNQIRLLEGSVLGATQEGYQNISTLQLAAAQDSFAQARNNLDSLNLGMRALLEVVPSGQDGLHVLSAGESISKAGAYLSEALDPLSKSQGQSSVVLLASISESLEKSMPHLRSANTHLQAINLENVPQEYQQKFLAALAVLPSIEAASEDVITLAGTLSKVLGAQSSKRYAVLFQNNNELRPAGGFIGSLAFVDITGGRVTNIEVPGGGAYDFQGYLSEHIKAPKPLSLVNARWELQDANWYPDWPTSAAKVAWFLEHAGYSSVDGVLAVQATTLVKLLEATGPIEFPEHEITLTSQNVLDEIQRQVELDYDLEKNRPKEYIGELLPRVLERVLASSGDEMLELLGLIKSEIKEKNMLFYFSDQETNQAFVSRGWQPRVLASKMDYLSVIHANIGGGKTDGVIAESWDQKITIDRDGNTVAELTLTREHRGDTNNVFQAYNNVDFVRVYAPEGSELISFEGTKPPPAAMFETPEPYFIDDFELTAIEGKVIIDEATGTRITNEFGKTVFGNWLQVDPGNVLVAKVKYKLPFKIKPYDVLNLDAKNGYSLIIQKQAGARTIPYSISLRYPSDWKIKWNKSVGDGEVGILGPGLTVFDGDLSSDTGFAVSFEK